MGRVQRCRVWTLEVGSAPWGSRHRRLGGSQIPVEQRTLAGFRVETPPFGWLTDTDRLIPHQGVAQPRHERRVLEE